MITLCVSLIALVAGYRLYGAVVEKIFGSDPSRQTPALSKADGVDYVPMDWKKIFLIQFLNIAGLGPIFGAVAGAMWGPVAFVWIVLGCIFAGAVHDYLSGMLSIRNGGASISEVVGRYMGTGFKQFMRLFSVVLLVLVGVVFVTGPAKILSGFDTGIGFSAWVYLIFAYYVLATLLPIDKLIGRIYPVFGFALLFMAGGILFGLLLGEYAVPEISFKNMHARPETFPIFPMLFITIACGAISGFHATQSPLMARCLVNERLGRRIFYGAMIAEGCVALVWAAAAMTFFGGIEKLNEVMAAHGGNAAWAVNEISNGMLGAIGGILALLGVVAAPITSGDTAFRSARLTVADVLSLEQHSLYRRLAVSVPLFIVGYLLTQINFSVIWRYFAWSNQTLATIVLWAGSMYLMRQGRFHWIATVPATLMTAVCATYLMIAPEGFNLPTGIAYTVGCTVAAGALAAFFMVRRKVAPADTLRI
jgi:carbon starvation protein CstA